MSITVTLNAWEVAQAASIGNQRTDNCLRRGYKDKYGAETLGASKGRDISILGCLGEMAAAKALGLPYTPGSFHDLGADGVGDYEIRCTERHSNSLIIRQADPSDRLFILVTTEDRVTFIVQGWYPAKAAKMRDEFQRSPNGRPPAWFVPSAALIDMRWLPRKPIFNHAA